MSKKVLIVDDNQDSINILAAMLKRAGYTVAIAKDGVEAIQMAKKENPALILLDIMMPRLDGFEVCHAVKSNPKTRDIPVVMVSGKTDFDSRYKALKTGAVDYLTKPIHPGETLQKVKAHLKQASNN